jgi:hypothetical protein
MISTLSPAIGEIGEEHNFPSKPLIVFEKEVYTRITCYICLLASAMLLLSRVSVSKCPLVAGPRFYTWIQLDDNECDLEDRKLIQSDFINPTSMSFDLCCLFDRVLCGWL